MEPLTLFDQSSLVPEGFRYYADFISPQDEQDLLASITQMDLRPMVFQGYTAKRKVASFGHDWNFATRKLSPGAPIPQSFEWLLSKTATHLVIDRSSIAELLVTEYPPGSVINWHRDAPSFDMIAGISLASDCTFRLRPYEKENRGRKSVIALPVRRRSLYVMQGEVRIDWEHSTSPVKSIRYSITLRTLNDRRIATAN